MEQKFKTPLLYINYFENGQFFKKGPYFSAEFDGYWGRDRVYYIVYDESLNFTRISVPFYHSLCAMV